jgi:hypothetical protein
MWEILPAAQSGNIAIVQYGFFCPMCGEGGYAILVKQAGAWKVADDVTLWAS